MTPYWPQPYPDELLYSLLARYAAHTASIPTGNAVFRSLGAGKVSTSIDLPCRLRTVQQVAYAHWNLDAREIAFRHTNLAYWAYGRTVEAAEMACGTMVGEDSPLSRKSPYLLLGVSASGVPLVRSMRLCAQCVEQEIANYGEPYWHRQHQLPTVAFCGEHGIALHETNIPTLQRVRGDALIPAGRAILERTLARGPMTRMDEKLLEISIRALHTWPPELKQMRAAQQLGLFPHAKEFDLRQIERWAASRLSAEHWKLLRAGLRMRYTQNWLRVAMRSTGPLTGAPREVAVWALSEYHSS